MGECISCVCPHGDVGDPSFCRQDGTENCKSCTAGYQLFNRQCVECELPHLLNSVGHCTTCVCPHGNLGGADNCTHPDGLNCKTCDNGYRLLGNKCISCVC